MNISINFSYQQILSLVKHMTSEQKKKLFELLQPEVNKKQGEKKKNLKRKAGSMKGLIAKMDDDFDAPLDDFKGYLN